MEEVRMYKSKDGDLFDNQEECLQHEKNLSFLEEVSLYLSDNTKTINLRNGS